MNIIDVWGYGVTTNLFNTSYTKDGDDDALFDTSDSSLALVYDLVFFDGSCAIACYIEKVSVFGDEAKDRLEFCQNPFFGCGLRHTNGSGKISLNFIKLCVNFNEMCNDSAIIDINGRTLSPNTIRSEVIEYHSHASGIVSGEHLNRLMTYDKISKL